MAHPASELTTLGHERTTASSRTKVAKYFPIVIERREAVDEMEAVRTATESLVAVVDELERLVAAHTPEDEGDEAAASTAEPSSENSEAIVAEDNPFAAVV